MCNKTNTALKLEQEFISTIKGKSLADLSDMAKQPLDNITALNDLITALCNNGIKYLFHSEEFLSLPIKAHYRYGESESFLIGAYPQYKEFVPHGRAVEITDGMAQLSFIVPTQENIVYNSRYKTVRDIIPLINFEE